VHRIVSFPRSSGDLASLPSSKSSVSIVATVAATANSSDTAVSPADGEIGEE